MNLHSRIRVITLRKSLYTLSLGSMKDVKKGGKGRIMILTFTSNCSIRRSTLIFLISFIVVRRCYSYDSAKLLQEYEDLQDIPEWRMPLVTKL